MIFGKLNRLDSILELDEDLKAVGGKLNPSGLRKISIKGLPLLPCKIEVIILLRIFSFHSHWEDYIVFLF
jgi:hypothetical protein